MRRLLKSGHSVVILTALLVAIIPFLVPSTFHLRIAALVFIFALAVVGLNLLMGFAGQVSLGHAGFFGIGAYAVAVLPTHFAIPSWIALIGGVVVAGLLAFVIGRPILKLKGHYLAVATLEAAVVISSANPPARVMPIIVRFAHRLSRPCTQYSQRPHVISGLTVTRRPSPGPSTTRAESS